MNIERKPVAFGDLRGWIKALDDAGEIGEVDAEVDWNIELGTVMRLAQGPGDGPALLFNNIKDYNKPTPGAAASSAAASSSYRRVAMMMGVAARHPSARARQDRPQHARRRRPAEDRQGHRPGARRTSSPARTSTSTSCRRRGGTGSTAAAISSPMAACVTKDHDTGVMNVGIYRGMVSATRPTSRS